MNRLSTLLAIKAIGLSPGLLANDRLVGCAIVDHFNRQNGCCDPGIQRISDLLGISPRTVIRSVRRLEKAGLLRKARHGGRGNRNSYEPAWARLAELDQFWQRKFKEQRASRQAVSHRPSQPSHLSGDNDVTETCLPHLSKETLGQTDNSKSRTPNKRQGSGLGRNGQIGCPLPNTKSIGRPAKEVAKIEAQRRWDTDLMTRLAGEERLYSLVLELITLEMIEAATKEELRHPDSGADWILQEIKLSDPTIAAEIERTKGIRE